MYYKYQTTLSYTLCGATCMSKCTRCSCGAIAINVRL